MIMLAYIPQSKTGSLNLVMSDVWVSGRVGCGGCLKSLFMMVICRKLP